MDVASFPLIENLKGSVLTNDQVKGVTVYLDRWDGDFSELNSKLRNVRNIAEINLRKDHNSCNDSIGRAMLQDANIYDTFTRTCSTSLNVGNKRYLRVATMAYRDFVNDNQRNEIVYSLAFEEKIPEVKWYDDIYIQRRIEELLPRLNINKVSGTINSLREKNGSVESAQIEGSALGENSPITLTAGRILDKSGGELFS